MVVVVLVVGSVALERAAVQLRLTTYYYLLSYEFKVNEFSVGDKMSPLEIPTVGSLFCLN